jgi:hypothetical protein
MRNGQIIDLRERGRRRHLPAGRTLHLVDLENLAGGSAASPVEIDIALDGYEHAVRFGGGDQEETLARLAAAVEEPPIGE